VCGGGFIVYQAAAVRSSASSLLFANGGNWTRNLIGTGMGVVIAALLA
jgi:hypothetical protein